MNIFINQVTSKETQEPNICHFLNTEGKKQILRLLEESINRPGTYGLGLACDILENAIDPVEPKDKKTIGEWLEMKGIEMESHDRKRFETQCSYDYRMIHGVPPKMVSRKGPSGHFNSRKSGYAPEDFPILEKALKKAKKNQWDYKRSRG